MDTPLLPPSLSPRIGRKCTILSIVGVCLGACIAIACLTTTSIGLVCYWQLTFNEPQNIAAVCNKIDVLTAIVLVSISSSVATVSIFATLIGISVRYLIL